MKTINKTEGLCDKCLKRVPARTFEQDGAVFIEKNCDEHGKFVALHAWDDPDIHKGLVKISTLDSQPAQVVAALTYKCNLNCRVCYARANEVDVKDLKIEDLDKINDYPIVFLSGGEPTFRPDLPAIISQLKSKGKKIVMFSNGLKLANRKYTRLLKEAGLRCVILQFDTVDDGECEYIRGKKIVNIKRKAIKNMQATGLPVYLYCTMIKNRSVERMKEIFDFAAGYSVIRAISVNPL